jgi:hypothetical protein
MKEIHALEKVFTEFSIPETIVISEPIPGLRLGKISQVKDGDGLCMAFIQTEDEFALLAITPAGMDPRLRETPVLCQFFSYVGRDPFHENPSKINPTPRQEIIFSRIGRQVIELCYQPKK